MKKIIIKWRSINTKGYRYFLKFIGLSKDKTSRSLFRLFQIASYSVVVILAINLFSLISPIEDSVGFGSFGDFFGGMLNPILTFLTFMGLLITIILQQKELRLTRSEIKTSSKALSEQSITLEKQRFENTFFSLLAQHNQLLGTICEDNPKRWSNGKSDLMHVYENCMKFNTLKEAKIELQKKSYLIGHYCRTLYQLLKLIATKHPGSKIGLDWSEELILSVTVSNEEKFYSNLVRSGLNYHVTQLLAVNCYSDDDSFLKFKNLIIRYQFLEHMPLRAQDRTNPALVESIDYYGTCTFGNNLFLKDYLKTEYI